MLFQDSPSRFPLTVSMQQACDSIQGSVGSKLQNDKEPIGRPMLKQQLRDSNRADLVVCGYGVEEP